MDDIYITTQLNALAQHNSEDQAIASAIEQLRRNRGRDILIFKAVKVVRLPPPPPPPIQVLSIEEAQPLQPETVESDRARRRRRDGDGDEDEA